MWPVVSCMHSLPPLPHNMYITDNHAQSICKSSILSCSVGMFILVSLLFEDGKVSFKISCQFKRRTSYQMYSETV